MSILNREQILEVKDLKIELAPVSEYWGGDVYVRGLTGRGRDKFESSIVEIRGKKSRTDLTNIRAKLAAATICDEDGNLLFSEKDAGALGEKSAAALQIVFVVAQRLSGLSDQDVEELTEALEANPLEDSASD